MQLDEFGSEAYISNSNHALGSARASLDAHTENGCPDIADRLLALQVSQHQQTSPVEVKILHGRKSSSTDDANSDSISPATVCPTAPASAILDEPAAETGETLAPDAGCSSSSELEPAPFLPAGVLARITSFLVNGEPPGVAMLHLLTLCGVCSQWRAVCREVSCSALGFDSFSNHFSSMSSVQRLRKLSSSQQEEVFVSAGKLLYGYSEVSFSGEGVTDRLLSTVASSSGPCLTKCKVQSSASVTDVGLMELLSTGQQIVTFEAEDLSRITSGRFLVTLFETCKQLQTVHLSNMPFLDWAPCMSSALFWAERPTITKLHARNVNLVDANLGVILSKLPRLTELELDGPARNLRAAAASCPLLQRVSFQVSCRAQMDEALSALAALKELRNLELIVKNFTLFPDQLRAIGMLPLVELRLDSFIYKQQPTLSRSSYSHVDNEGVKALVDSICNRWCAIMSEMRPLKLSLCGASMLTHDAVSALLRLPILTELDIAGCSRIIAMDKMRLVAKVRAGREMLESGRRPNIRSSRFPGLML